MASLIESLTKFATTRKQSAVENVSGLVQAELTGTEVDPAKALRILETAGMSVADFRAKVDLQRQRVAKLAIVSKQSDMRATLAELTEREANVERQRIEFEAWRAAECADIAAKRTAASIALQQASEAESWLLSTATDAAAKRDYETAKALWRAVTDRLSACKRDIDRISKQDLPHATSQLDFNVEHDLPREAEQLRVNQLKNELAELVSTRAKSETLRAERESAVNSAREALLRS